MTTANVVERTELITPGPAHALAGLLGVAEPDHWTGLPLMWHWLYNLERPAQADLGPDGHPIRGTVPAPPGPGRRRMWAGGRVETKGPLLIGAPATRRTRVLKEEEKDGRSGRLAFVTVGHEIWQHDRLVVTERQDIVYRDAVAAATQAPTTDPEPLPIGPREWSVEVSPTLLFRFSALTYNGHRIHYDREYAMGVEGYPGLVTHGPLQAICLAEAARRDGRDTSLGAALEYRLVSPLFDYEGLVVQLGDQVANGSGQDVTVRAQSGRTTARGLLS